MYTSSALPVTLKIFHVALLKKQVEYHDVFIYSAKYKLSSVTLTLVKPDTFGKN